MLQKLLLAVFAAVSLLSMTDLAQVNGLCDGAESIRFKALKGHTFSTMHTANPQECHEKCQEDLRCQSFNFVIRNGECELNDRTKEAKPKNFITDMERFYMKRGPHVVLGSVAEIPADSCEEIKLSENENAVSDYYWLDPYRSGDIHQVYCDMEEPFEDSASLSVNVNMKQIYIDKLLSYLAPVLQPGSRGWQKCYQATVDGWASSTFHSRCNFKGPTVTIVRYGSYILGGYTSISWQNTGSCTYRRDDKAFLFTLYNTNGYYPEKLTPRYPQYAIYDCYSRNPTFGGGHDLMLRNQAYVSYVRRHSYARPKNPFVSPSQFIPSEIEVFYETIR